MQYKDNAAPPNEFGRTPDFYNDVPDNFGDRKHIRGVRLHLLSEGRQAVYEDLKFNR